MIDNLNNDEVMQLNPDMLLLARQSKGWKQHELAKLLKISQGLLSKCESGEIELRIEVVEKIAELLNYPISFFYDKSSLYPFGFYLYRKYSTIPKSQLETIVANLKIYLLQLDKLLAKISIEKPEITHVEVSESMKPDVIAYLIREKYRVPPGPIKSICNFIENLGVIIYPVNILTRMFSGLTVPLDDQSFVIFVNMNMPHDRLRFTLAHELGHIIMHNRANILSDTFDEEANQFASAFLMPEYDIEDDLVNLDLKKLALLKMHWHVSMATLLIRAKSLGKITESRYVSIYKLMSKLGYKSQEPIECVVPEEEPMLLKNIIQLFKNEMGYNESDIYNLLNCTEEYFKKVYLDNVINMSVYVKEVPVKVEINKILPV